MHALTVTDSYVLKLSSSIGEKRVEYVMKKPVSCFFEADGLLRQDVVNESAVAAMEAFRPRRRRGISVECLFSNSVSMSSRATEARSTVLPDDLASANCNGSGVAAL